MNNDRVTSKHKEDTGQDERGLEIDVLDVDEPKEDVLDVDVEDGAVFGILSHRPLCLQHDVLRAVCHIALM